MTAVRLLGSSGSSTTLELREPPALARPTVPLRSRVVYAAAHVVPRSTAENVPGAPADLDWEATLAFRRHVWSWGLGVADAMDTAQRGMGLDLPAVRELIGRSAAEAAPIARERGVPVSSLLVVGVGTDQLVDDHVSLDAVVDAYVEQLEAAESTGAGVVLMASRHLARAATSAADYERVYGRVLARATRPVVLHWLGEAFDPVLRGYFGSTDVAAASDTVLRIVATSPDRVGGLKMSLLDASAEVALRARFGPGTAMLTGDDYHYVELIRGDGARHSDALLGAFAAIAPLASAAVQALDAGDDAAYTALLEPTEALSRQVFAAPTWFYKTGVAFLSWLNGHQDAFSMVGGLHSGRSLVHLGEIVRLADACGALERPDLAADRWQRVLAVHGVEAPRRVLR